MITDILLWQTDKEPYQNVQTFQWNIAAANSSNSFNFQ